MAKSNGPQDIIERTVTLSGFMPLMFDRYAGGNTTQLPVDAKLYYMPDGKTLCFPAGNLLSFLSAKNTTSVARLIGGKNQGKLADALLAFVQISPACIPITREGTPITFNGFVDGRDEQAGLYVDQRVARLPKGIPNFKERPVVNLPWEVSFQIRLFKNDVVDETLLKEAFRKGGLAIGLGTFRGLFGKFVIESWE